MKQTEALNLAIEMLERVAPGRNYGTREFYDRLRDIKSTVLPATNADPTKRASTHWPKTSIVDGEEFCEIDRKTVKGRNLILMESCRDGGEAPAIIIDADTNETVLDEVNNGFQDYCDELDLTAV
jgi:hypothetical protein